MLARWNFLARRGSPDRAASPTADLLFAGLEHSPYDLLNG
jgi:hypothetical protein